jgi:uncharacterized surface protein with fasciclin (FAS1) repeats
MAHIIDTLGDAGIFTSLILGLQRAGLADLLKGNTPYTIFAPTDTAFDQLSDETYASLFNNIHQLTSILQCYIVPGVYTAVHLLDRISLKTLQQQRLFIRSTLSHPSLDEDPAEELAEDVLHFVVESIPSQKLLRSITINTISIIHTDIKADNGVIHAIDRVFLPLLIPLPDQQ